MLFEPPFDRAGSPANVRIAARATQGVDTRFTQKGGTILERGEVNHFGDWVKSYSITVLRELFLQVESRLP